MRTKLNKACDLSSGSFFTPQSRSNVSKSSDLSSTPFFTPKSRSNLSKSCDLSSTPFCTPQSRSNLSKSCDFSSKSFCTPQFRKPNVPRWTQTKPGNTVSRPPKYKEVPSGSVDPNVQVLVRVRPLNSMEISKYGHDRCLKLESSQSITWIGQPETSFRFDYLADETVDQEMLFMMVGRSMVENCVSGYNSCMFAYGQAGSGKSYTMLGEIDELERKPSAKHGMTTRIFEFLFAKIQDEEKARRDEKLKHHCKCSFFEIYNEQIKDLLDPSSTNLLPREDAKKGVYVANLSESEVQTGADIIKLIILGTSNRKVEETNLNRESSRSHCVFTCVIESTWEKDTMTKVRFARLNLVDLAGYERQKTSGAEGERLKEASSINKSLFALGHVIDILVDVANGKLKHVPYRDSRLTFLLQDSVGGNSKTIIIANVSPSICSAAATLSTLKFAQRAKLIENTAVVNEEIETFQEALKLDLEQKTKSVNFLSSQNMDLTKQVKSILAAKCLIEEELIERKKTNESLKIELLEVTTDRDQLSTEVTSLKESQEALKLDLEQKTKSVNFLSSQNVDLTKQVKSILAAKCLVEEELIERKKMNESLEIELLEVTTDRDQLSTEVTSLKESLEKAQFQVHENEAIASEAQQAIVNHGADLCRLRGLEEENYSLKYELIERKKTNESLEAELLEVANALSQLNGMIGEVTTDQDQLSTEAQFQVHENEAIPLEAEQMENEQATHYKPRKKWTAEEVGCLKTGFTKYGRQWSLILAENSKVLGKRTGQNLKDKYRNMEKAEQKASQNQKG